MPTKRLPPRPDLRHLKHQVADLRADHRLGKPDALRRIRECHPRFGNAADGAIASAKLTQSDALLTIAREYGFASWPKIKRHIESLEAVQRRVSQLQEQFAHGDAATRRRLLQPAHARERFENYDPDAASLSENDARLLIANEEGYAFWQKYESYLYLDPSVQRAIAAVRSGDREALLEILRDDPSAANPHWVPGFSSPALVPNDSIPLFCVSEAAFRHTNTRGNEYDLVRDLAKAGADVDFQWGMALAAAASFGVPRAVEALLDSGAEIDGVDDDGTHLAYALHFGFSETAQLFARRGAKTDLRFDAGLGRLDAVKNWFDADGSLKAGAGALVDPYALEHKLRGQSPFRCERTRENILSQALYFACIHGQLEVAELLLSQGAEINSIVPGLDSRATVLHHLVYREDDLESVVRLLADRGADFRVRDQIYYSTPLGWARFLKRQASVELLLSLGAQE